MFSGYIFFFTCCYVVIDYFTNDVLIFNRQFLIIRPHILQFFYGVYLSVFIKNLIPVF